MAAEKEDAIRFDVVCLAMIYSSLGRQLLAPRLPLLGRRIGGFWESKPLTARGCGWLGRIARPTPGIPIPRPREQSLGVPSRRAGGVIILAADCGRPARNLSG